MIDTLYLDEKNSTWGNFFELDGTGKVQTEEGHSYELDAWIDRGGNAAIYQCRDCVEDEEYAIKFLMNNNPKDSKRFDREIQLIQSVRANNLIKYYGTGRVQVIEYKNRQPIIDQEKKIPFIVMELADENLQKVMYRERGNISYQTYAGQFRGLANALASLHEYAIHRDIKPENILVAGERWLLSDYGLCSFINSHEEDLTSNNQRLLGPKYWLSPEAHNRRLGCGDEISAASDVFQLAAIFWYVVTGNKPTGVVTKDDWEGPSQLFTLLHKSLLHDCKKRPQNGHEFLTDLEKALNV